MAILNYTTKIKPEKTAGEIQKILGTHGAQAVMSEYEAGEIVAVSFRVELNGQYLSFRLPINWMGVEDALLHANIPGTYQNTDQAKRTAWRIVKDWIEAQMALVEAQQADIIEVFLPYMQDNNGKTVYQRLQSNNFKALGYDG